jgi:hypothetical protein
MKLLVIISSHEMRIEYYENIQILHDYMKSLYIEVDYCGISNQDDFSNYEHILQFKFKIINRNQQLSKICDFITDYRSQLDYDWYMKIRPDIKLLENICFDMLSEDAINARARVYNGPREIKHGMSINGEGAWSNIGDCFYSEKEHDILLDDMFFMFHKNVVEKNAFDKIITNEGQHESTHTRIFNERNIPLNVIGVYMCNTKYNGFSGNIPWPNKK